MNDAPVKNAPLLAGWAIAAGAGLVGTGVSWVAIGLGSAGAVLVGSVLFVVVGLILGLPRDDGHMVRPAAPMVRRMADQAPAPAPQAAPAVAPMAAPQAAPTVAPAPLPPAAPVMAAPMPASPPVDAASVPQVRPQGLAAPRGGQADDLKIIKGIGPKLEVLCHSLGYYHFDQIAAWTPAEVAWVDDNLEGFKGRVTRDAWVAQAKVLAAGGTV